MKKIVIAPVFCETHLIKYQIPNIIDTIDPDYIIYNEGMFPAGPESSTKVDRNFIKNYTLDGHRGFDYEELREVIKDAQEKYPNTKIILNEMNYPNNLSAPECYALACSNFEELGIKIEKGDYIFPFEGDVFHLESAKREIEGYMSQLEPDTGFRTIWLDFMETQNYVEKKNLVGWKRGDGRSRRVCIRFGTWGFYRNVLLNFMTQQYPMLYPTDLITYHYCWFRPQKYKQLRFDQLNRGVGYWENFDKGLQQIRNENPKTDVVLRPESPVDSNNRYAAYLEIEHPTAIKQHPNFVK